MKPESWHLLGMHLTVKRKKNTAGAYNIKILFFSLIPIFEASTGNISNRRDVRKERPVD